MPRLGSGALLTRFSVALDFLESIGLRVPATGRARRAAQLLRRLNDGQITLDPSDAAGLRRAEAAHRTAWEISLISYARFVARHGANPFPLSRLSVMMGGADLPEAVGTQARDAQFELFVAAMLRLGGADVRHGEPDLRLLFGQERVGIAAKRITSQQPAQLRRHVGRAADQIANAGLRGFVAVNLDSRFLHVAVPASEPDRIAAFERVFDQVSQHESPLERHHHVLGWMVYGHLADWRFVEGRLPELRYVAPFRWFGWTDDPASQKLFEDFTSSWRSRLEAHLRAFLSWKELY